MSESAAYARRGTSGAAKSTTLASGIGTGDGSITAADLSTWVACDDNGPFRFLITDGTTEEECEGTAVSGNTITGVTRGVGGTSAAAWSSGVTLKHVISVRDIDEANRLVNLILGVGSVVPGDLYYVSAASGGVPTTLARVPKGTAYQKLRMNAGATAPEWTGMSGVAMHKSGTLSVPGSGGTLVPWETEDYDTDSYHSGTSSTITLPFTGKYAFAYSIDWTNGATVTAGPVSLYAQLSGVTIAVGAEKATTTELLANGEHVRSGGGHFTASATNTFTFVVDNTSGNSTLTVAAVSNIQVTFLGP